MSEVNICGLLIHVHPTHLPLVRENLNAFQGVEVHSVMDDGRMIVTVDTNTQDEMGQILNRLQSMERVLSTSLVYQYFDDKAYREA